MYALHAKQGNTGKISDSVKVGNSPWDFFAKSQKELGSLLFSRNQHRDPSSDVGASRLGGVEAAFRGENSRSSSGK